MSSSQASKRTKLTTACDNCRKRKIKCDGINPNRCNNCRNREGAVCTYNGTQPSRTYKVSYVEDIEEELSRCHALLGEGVSSVDTLKRKNNSDIIPSSDYADLSDEYLVDNIDGLYIPADAEKDNTKFFGKSSLRGLFGRIEAYTSLNTLDFIKEKRPQYWFDDWSREISPHSYFTNLPYTNEDFGDVTLLEQLITLYFKKVNISMPLLNESHFRKQIPHRKLERTFGTILMLVAALGALYINDSRLAIPGRENLKFLQGYYYYNIAVEKMPNYMKTSAGLEDIQALILLQMYVQRGVHTKSSSMINGLTILLSQSIGLHYKFMDPNNNNIMEKEARKRAWWILYIIDRSNTACFGRTLLIKDDEMHLDLVEATAEDPLNNIVSIEYINDIIKICEIHGQITHKLYKFRKSNVGEDAILKTNDIATLNTKINDWINDVSINDKDIKDDTTYQFRANIKLAFYNAQLILYRPFMPCPKLNIPTSNFQTASLAICSNASRSIICIYSDLVLNRQVDRIWTDCIISWCPFWATLIMILSYCESKRIGNIRYQDLDYIKTGILTLRGVESKNVLYGRAVDILLPIVKAILPPGDNFIEDQQRISFNTEFHSNVAANTIQLPQDNGNVIEQDDSFFRDMLEYLKFDSSSSVYGNYNSLITPEHENDLNMMINSMLDGDAV